MKVSKAQAKFLARCWGTDMKPAIVPNGYIEPTTLACIKRGWLMPTNERGSHPNGMEFTRYAISQDGLKAIAQALSGEANT